MCKTVKLDAEMVKEVVTSLIKELNLVKDSNAIILNLSNPTVTDKSSLEILCILLSDKVGRKIFPIIESPTKEYPNDTLHVGYTNKEEKL